jgi:hypothetical protein
LFARLGYAAATNRANLMRLPLTIADGGTVPMVEHSRLIAAAPDLLNALEIAVATIQRLERHAPGSQNGTLDVARAAIAKARGE